MHASTWQLMSRSVAIAAIASIGSITPCGYWGAEPDDEHGVVVDRVSHRVGVRAEVLRDRDANGLDAEVVRCLCRTPRAPRSEAPSRAH